ncbi:MAG: helix-turn-helix transcriptional regulator [Lentisphaeria bacterium]|nr:helix-turn-helix transcriptional regulator [Lentisphaeria bacterium]
MEIKAPELVRVGHYECPAVTEVVPVRIACNMEMVEILSGGKLRFEVDGEERIFTKGAVFWHQYGEQTICKTFREDPYRCLVLHFRVPENGRPGPRVSVWENPDEAVAFAEECRRAFHSGTADLPALSAFAYSTIRWKGSLAGRTPIMEYPDTLLRAASCIRNHLGEELTPDRLARAAGISRPYLFTLFRKYYGKAPLHYVQEQRIIHAKVLLTAGDESSIKEIAQKCGFRELEVFYRQFRSHTGFTPAQYRRKYSVRTYENGE